MRRHVRRLVELAILHDGEDAALVRIGEPAFELSCIDQLAALFAAEIEAVETTVFLSPSCDDERVARLISIGTPVDKYDFGFLVRCRKPILFVHGEHDEYGNVDRLRELVSRVASNAPAELGVIKGAGHFFDNQLDELKRAITDWAVTSRAE